MAVQASAMPLNRAGVVVRLNGDFRFLPLGAVRRFVASPSLSDVSGTGLTMALVDGQVLAVLAVGAHGSALTVCEVGGELVGLVGPEPEAVGFFASHGSGVSYQGQSCSALDVAELVRASARRGSEPMEPEE